MENLEDYICPYAKNCMEKEVQDRMNEKLKELTEFNKTFERLIKGLKEQVANEDITRTIHDQRS